MADDTRNQISGGIFFSAAIQGRNITVQLPPQVPPALSGLPLGSSAFTGRADDLRAVLDTLAPRPAGNRQDPSADETTSVSAVVVTAVGGMGGVGKTELAIQAARTALARGWFPGGVLFVNLFGYDLARWLDPGQALEGFLRALGIPGEHIPPDVQDRSRLYASVLTAYAEQDRPILVVIDNASSPEQARPLLPADQSNRVIITSRHTLGMLGARLLDLNVLASGEAVELLDRSLRIAHPDDTRISDHPADAAMVAGLCGGLPLALQIVAALLADDLARPLAAMAADLADASARLEEMSYGEVAVRAAFELSYQHLSSDQARLFRLLAVNPGPDLSTAGTAVLAGIKPVAARRLLEALARAHLIEHGSAYGRWRMHDLVHLFADQHGCIHADADGRQQALTALLGHYLVTTDAADRHLNPTDPDPAAGGFGDRDQALAWLDAEYPNLIAAVHTAAVNGIHRTIARSLPLALARFLEWRRLFTDSITLTTHALHAARHLNDRHSEIMALNNLGFALSAVRRFDDAITTHQQNLQICRETGDRHGEAMTLTSLGLTLQQVRRFDDAITALQDASHIYQETGDQHSEGAALNNLGLALHAVRRFDDAITALQDASHIYRETGDRHGEGTALNNLGSALRMVWRFDDAITAHHIATRIFQETGDQHGEAMTLTNLGSALQQIERFDDAITALQDATRIFQEIGDRHGEAMTLTNLGRPLGRV
ncbi:ATP-binding protein [Streptosporangium canum]|uniref:ATP-binding protein n=1 Tax=Streptosporangium canum TaxID=324952 RepID=UPI0037B970AE